MWRIPPHLYVGDQAEPHNRCSRSSCATTSRWRKTRPNSPERRARMERGERPVRRPSAEEVFTAWEMVGESRRDSRLHRGQLLSTLAYFSLLAAGTSFLCLLTGLGGFLLGLAAWKMACRDLEVMRAGLMEQAGYHPTEKARADGRAATLLSVPGLLLWAILMAVVIYSTVDH
jgi:hypothetical protein